MQSNSSRIWTCVAVSISYDDNHGTIDTPLVSMYIVESWLYIYIYIYINNEIRSKLKPGKIVITR